MPTPTNDWNEHRLGSLTASEIIKLLKGGTRPMTAEELSERVKGDTKKTMPTDFGDGAMSYIYEKIAECVTGEKPPSFDTGAMAWGREYEKDACMDFEKYTGLKVTYYGMENPKFFQFNDISGGSPDGFIETEKALLEIKCLNSANHIPLLIASLSKDLNKNEFLKSWDEQKYAQVQFNMMCTKAVKGYLVSYDPRTIEHSLRRAIFEIQPDKEYQMLIEDKISKATVIINNLLTILMSTTN